MLFLIFYFSAVQAIDDGASILPEYFLFPGLFSIFSVNCLCRTEAIVFVLLGGISGTEGATAVFQRGQLHFFKDVSASQPCDCQAGKHFPLSLGSCGFFGNFPLLTKQPFCLSDCYSQESFSHCCAAIPCPRTVLCPQIQSEHSILWWVPDVDFHILSVVPV